MGEVQEVQLQIMGEEDKEAKLPVQDQPTRNYWRWIRIAMYTFFVLSGQSAAILLGRLYYESGGNSKWLLTLVQLVGFPILLPVYFFSIPPKTENRNTEIVAGSSFLILASVYVALGIFIAAYYFLYSIGLLYLPVSTYSIIGASQLAFNSLFSFFLNKQKFTPYIINSLVLITISSILLAFQNQSENTTGRVSKQKYAIGFICTVGASAATGLQFSLTQLAFRKYIKRETLAAILDMIIYPSFVASCATVVGLFVSREWMSLSKEMEEYKLGKVSYIMTLVWIAIIVQIFSIGSIGLIFETSSLFSNAINVVGLPIVPVLALVFFHDKMHGLKVIAMVLAIWGFASFVYQHYLDDRKSKSEDAGAREVSQASSSGS